MGLYNVVKPCVVDNLHYVRPTTQPIEVDDTEAAELVGSGCLTPYPVAAASALDLDDPRHDANVVEVPTEIPRPRRPRRGTDEG